MKSLNLKDPEAYRLAATISQMTGRNMTQVVVEALQQRFERLQASKRKASVEDLLAIANRISTQVNRPYIDHADLLYDETGLPK